MLEWFEFTLNALAQIVQMVFSLDLGLGFSMGDFDVALLLIGLIATALLVKTGSFASQEVSGAKSYTEKLDREWNAEHKVEHRYFGANRRH